MQRHVSTMEFQNEPNNSIAWQRFTPLGPLGILPLTKELSSLAWTTSTDDANRLIALPEDEFVDELNDYLVRTVQTSPTLLDCLSNSHHYALQFNARSQNYTANAVLSAMDKVVDRLRLPGITRRDTERLCLPYVKSVEPGTRASFPVGFGQAREYVHPRAVLIGLVRNNNGSGRIAKLN